MIEKASFDCVHTARIDFFLLRCVWQVFGSDPSAAEEQIEKLKMNKWINEGTQWLRVEFVVYNPNIGAFLAVQMKTDFDLTGTLYHTYLTEYMIASNYSTVRC